MSLLNPGRIAVVWTGSTTQAEVELELLNLEIAKTQKHAKEVGGEIRTALNASLLLIRGVVDLSNLVSAATGEAHQGQFATLISLGISNVLAIQTQIQVFSANPGTWPLALSLLAVLPVVTGMLLFIRSESDRSKQARDDQILDDIAALEDF